MMDIVMDYPLVICYIAIEHGHLVRGFTQEWLKNPRCVMCHGFSWRSRCEERVGSG